MEILGVTASVAGVASLTIQLIEKAQQLREFWKSFREAPAEIEGIANDLEVFCELIERCAKLQHAGFATLEKVLAKCGDSIEVLVRFTERLELGFASRNRVKRNWAAFKAVLKKDELEKFQNSLRHTKQDLIIAIQLATGSSLQKSIDDHARRNIGDNIAQSSRISSLQRSVDDFAFQSSANTTTINSHFSDVHNHVTDVAIAVQNLARELQVQTSLPTSAFIEGAIERTLRKAIQDIFSRKDMREVLDTFKNDSSSGDSNMPESLFRAEKLPANLSHETTQEYWPQSKSRKRPAREVTIPKKRRRVVTKNISGECGTWFGILIWQIMRSRVVYEHSDIDSTQLDELQTSVTLQPSSWLLMRRFHVQVARKTQGWNFNVRYYPVVPKDALIFKYCKTGNVDGVRDLLQHNHASPWDVGHYGLTPLHFAAQYYQPAICELLIQAGANVDAVDDGGMPACDRLQYRPFYSPDAISERVISVLRILLAAGANTSFVGYRGFNFLYRCSQGGTAFAVEWLLRREDSDIDVRHLNLGNTSIMDLISCSAGVENENLLNLLITNGVDINSQSSDELSSTEGFTAIHFAVIELRNHKASRAAYLNILLRNGADPHAVDSYGLTPTAIAMRTSQSFFRWRKSLEELDQLSEEFAMEDVSRSSYLQTAGWDGHSLFKLFTCKFHAINDPRIQRSISFCYGNKSMLWEPWWYDLLRYIRLERGPIPPLPRGWQKYTSKAGHTSYFSEELGIQTLRRPRGKFFSNMRNPKARKAYAKGSAEIKTRLPRLHTNQRSGVKRRRYLTFLKKLHAHLDHLKHHPVFYPQDISSDSEADYSDEDNRLSSEDDLSYEEDERTDQLDDESDIELEWSDEEDDFASWQEDDLASGEQAVASDEEVLYEDALEALQEVHINP